MLRYRSCDTKITSASLANLSRLPGENLAIVVTKLDVTDVHEHEKLSRRCVAREPCEHGRYARRPWHVDEDGQRVGRRLQWLHGKIAEFVIASDGDVKFVPGNMMPTDTGVAAVLRYAMEPET